MRLLWKLLRRHVSVSQLAGFFLANLLGLVVVLMGIQFYHDVVPLFTEGDSFLKKEYVVVSKKVSTIGTFVGRDNTFSPSEVEEFSSQPFVKGVGSFIPSKFRVTASVGMEGTGIQMSTDMFFESVPAQYVDVSTEKWNYLPGATDIPIIIPRNYLNLYNFGFAQSRNMPKISEGLMSMIKLDILLRGNGRSGQFTGHIAGFSNRLNTILVPEQFMAWANAEFASGEMPRPARLIVELENPADDRFARFVREKGYDTEDDKLDAGKTTWFLKLTVGIVMAVGLLICLLSVYVLMLSIYLLLQKNATKLENLLFLGYSPIRVALPYQLLTVILNGFVLLAAFGAVWLVRSLYLSQLQVLAPDLSGGAEWPVWVSGICLMLVVTIFNGWVIHRKVMAVWNKKIR